MKTSLKVIVGRRIKEARNKLKITQQELAEEADVDYKYLQRMEGKTPPNLKLETIERIATALKINPAKLLDF